MMMLDVRRCEQVSREEKSERIKRRERIVLPKKMGKLYGGMIGRDFFLSFFSLR